jgi:hypothetical protein
LFGYARNQSAYGNAGTIKWLEDHLKKYYDPASAP